MKKCFLIITMLVLSVASLFAWSGSYSIKCPGCSEHGKQYHSGCRGCPMWRMYELEGKSSKYAGYMVYHCQHGHTVLIPYGTDKNTQDLNEIKIVAD